MELPVNVDPEDCPLTPAQAGLLGESVMPSSPGVHVQQVVFGFDDTTLDPSRLRDLWAGLVVRHAALRRICQWRDLPEPRLRQPPAGEILLSVEHYDGLSATERSRVLDEWLRADRTRGVAVDRAPAWRLAWLTWGNRQATLVWTFHHLFLDGPSIEIVVREFLLAVNGAVAVPPAVGAVAAPDQADHVQALQRRQSDGDLQAQAQAHFAHFLKSFDMPGDGGFLGQLARSPLGPSPSMAVEDQRVAQCTLGLAPAMVRGLESLAQSVHGSLSNVLKAAWLLVLSRWTGNADVVLGVVRSGRHLLPGAACTVGCLINTVPLRQTLRAGQRLGELLGEVNGSMQALRPFETVALADVLRWSGQKPGTDLLQLLFLFEPRPLHARVREAFGDDCRVSLLEQGVPGLFLMAYADQGIELRLEYGDSVLSEAGAHELLSSLQRLLGAMAGAHPDTPLAALGFLQPPALEVLQRHAWPAAAVDAVDACVLTRIESQARERPDALAVHDLGSGRQLTYAQLDAAANRCADWLCRRGVQTEDRVALGLPRGLDFITAMIAVMKCGAVWVPVDPAYPAQATRHMLVDSGARLLLVQRGSVWEAPPGVSVRCMDEADDESATETSVLASQRGSALSRPAYLIYTSGSTGTPKGVEVGHQALAAHAQAMVQAYALCPADRVLQFASLSFDVSLEEIVPTLVAGASLVLRDDTMAESLPGFFSAVEAQRLTVLNLPTAFWQACVEHMGLSHSRLSPHVRLMVIGGEKAPRPVFETFRSLQPALRLINAYGPTEATISCTAYDTAVRPELPPGHDVPVGRPLGHARLVVLAPDGSLAPPGATGELWIGGPCLASGYLGLPALTAERFVPAAEALDPSLVHWGLKRLYRSGDLAWWDADGQLRLLGRADRQVKLRGYRIELAQIEASAERLDGVAQAVAAVDRPDAPEAGLMVWVLPRPGQRLEASVLSAELRRQLPAHMWPHVQVVDRWPVGAGGKIDVQRLIRQSQKEVGAEVAPATTAQGQLAVLAGLFAGVLGRSSVSPHESFFDLGGNSLQAIRLIASIERETGWRVSIGQLKSFPSPSALQLVLSGDKPASSAPRYLVEIQPDGSRPPIYGVHSLGSGERFYRPLAACLPADQPLFGLTTGYSLLSEPDLSLERLAQVYFEDIMRHRPEGPLVLAAISMCAYVAFELARQLRAAGRDVRYLVFFDAEGPDGRPPLPDPVRRLRLHGRSMAREGPFRYVLGRLAVRLTYAGGFRTRLGLALSRRLGLVNAQPYDHPDDALFVGQLADMVNAYQPATYEGDLLVFVAEDEAFFDRRQAEKGGLGWSGCCQGRVRLIYTPGGHLSMLSPPFVQTLADQLSASLTRTWEKRPKV
jgi:amino acid adenylation domain-containing protein